MWGRHSCLPSLVGRPALMPSEWQTGVSAPLLLLYLSTLDARPCGRARDHAFEKASLPAPQTGQTQSSGRLSHGVPGGMPCSGSPRAGS